MVHLYYGDGKGKTTAAMGLALRAIGHGMKVVVVQFLKNGKSGELMPLIELGVKVFSGKPQTKFFKEMSEAEREETKRVNDENLKEALSIPCDLLILDEACAACRLGMVDEEMLRSYVERDIQSILESDLKKASSVHDKETDEQENLDASGGARSAKPEIVLTGREPLGWMMESADYITEMHCVRHPYERGVRARLGIEL